eukprot:9825424-Ditylum_brightwellii.AAC.1
MSDTTKYTLESFGSDRFDTESITPGNDSDSTVATPTYLFKSGPNNAVIGASNDYLQRKKQVVEFFNEVFDLSRLKEGRHAPSMFDLSLIHISEPTRP